MSIAVKVEGLSKRFLLGESIEHTLSSRVGDLLRGRGLRRSAGREEFWALRDVNFEVEEGQALGIIGGNGAGKSTLLKVLSRITPPTEGRARVKGRLSSLLEVGTGFHPELTGRENVFLNGAILGMRKAEVQRKFDEIVAFSGVEKFIDTPVKRYSSGMYVRLAFAVAAHLEPDVLIIDEVLAVGDADFQKRCLGKMGEVAGQGRTVLFVSHNMAAVQKLCQRAVWMQGGKVRFEGTSNATVAAYIGAQVEQQATDAPPGLLYAAAHDDGSTRALKVELLDVAGNPMARCATWDDVRLRITYRVAERYSDFGVEVMISTLDAQRLIRTSTSPDHALALRTEPGIHTIDCTIARLPLTAGNYLFGVNLTVPRVCSLWKNEAMCELEVGQRDVFSSGMFPSAPRYLVVPESHWTRPTEISQLLP